MKTENVQKFYEKAASLGYDQAGTLKALNVKDLAEFSGAIGQALNILSKAREAERHGQTSAVLALPEAARRALYPSDELAQRGKMLRAFAPWAHGDEPVTDQEIALVVLRADSMALDALNPHEAEIWKDKRGAIRFQLSYVLISQWMQEFHGGHTEPRYTPLTEVEKATDGIPPEDKAIRCQFVMKSDIALIKEMINAGWDAQEARTDLMVRGQATVSNSDWNAAKNGKEYFAPNGRSKAFKLEKRAYIDAVRRRFGEPSPSAIYQLRRARGEETITAEDWKVAHNESSPDTRARHAKAAADHRQREPITSETAEATLQRNREILRGSIQEADWDARPEPPKKTGNEEKPPRPWTPDYLRQQMNEKIARLREDDFAFEDGKLRSFQGACQGALELCFAGDEQSTDKRHLVSGYLLNKPSSTDWDDAETKIVHLWLAARPDDTGEWQPAWYSTKEAIAVAREALREAGQMDLFDEEAEKDVDAG